MERQGRLRWAWIALGLFLVGLAILGALLPVIPGTVFAIAAAACFARSSERLENWLLDHPWFGASIRAWRANGAIPLSVKLVAIGSMGVSGVGLAWSAPWFVSVPSGLFLVGCAGWVGSRPRGTPGSTDEGAPPSER